MKVAPEGSLRRLKNVSKDSPWIRLNVQGISETGPARNVPSAPFPDLGKKLKEWQESV